MKVVAFNGSPKKKGNTREAIEIVADELRKEGIEVEVITVGDKIIRGCIGCDRCTENKDEKCILKGDEVNSWIEKMKQADGIILGSPVYSSAMNATLKAFLDRAFYVVTSNRKILRHKVGISIVSARRAGGVAAVDQLNNYLNYCEMVLPTSNYWNVIYGADLEGERKDLEGSQTLRVLGKNMAWIMKMIENSKGVIVPPKLEEKEYTPLIRRDV